MKRFFLLFILLPFTIIAQIEHGGKPYFFKNKQIQTLKLILPKVLPEPKKNALMVGYNFSIPKIDGTWLNTKNNYVWLLRISSPKAVGLSLIFNDFNLKDGDSLFVISANSNKFLGAFTKDNNRKNKIFPVAFIPDSILIIELHTTEKKLPFKLKTVVYYFSYPLSSGSCEVNIACESNEPWITLKRSVCKITFSSSMGTYVCSGAMIANTSFRNIPYFLTATHCISLESEAASAVFYFHYQSRYCITNWEDNYFTISGSELISKGDKDNIDFTLLKMNEIPPEDYQPYYAGWNRDNKPPNNTVCIHHPQGDLKKISKDNDPPKIGTFTGYKQQTHWHILKWDQGTTEGGSSGAPLLDPDGLIIGTLTGGSADCENPVDDYFQMLYYSWKPNTIQTQQLQHWLDPLGFEPIKMPGYDPYINDELDTPTVSVSLNFNVATVNCFPPEYADSLKIYKNLQLIKTVPAQNYSFDDTLTQPGIYVYFARALFQNRLSKPSNMAKISFGDFQKFDSLKIIPFPNPFSNILFILITKKERKIKQLWINDIFGREVIYIHTEKYYINLENLAPGVYFLKTQLDNGQIFVNKIVKFD